MSNLLKKYRSGLLTFGFVFIAMFGVGYVSADYLVFPDSVTQSANLSSVLMHAKMGKSLSFVNVQLESNEVPDGPNEVAEISGFITLLKTSNNVITYEWLLPEGVTIIEGDKEGRIESVAAEVPVTVKIKVNGYTKAEKKLISLSGTTKIGENAFSNVAILSSRPEDSHEFIARQRFDSEKLHRLDFSSESPKDLRSDDSKIQR